MNVTTIRLAVIGMAMAVIAGVSVGCSSDGGGKGGKAVAGLQDTRTELAKGRKQVEENIAAANALRNAQGDVSQPYKKLVDETKQTEKERENLRKRWADMQKRGKEYQTQWQEEVSKMQNPELRAAATQRAATVRERYDIIREKAREARDAYDPFMRDLKELQSYVASDLTPAAVEAAGPAFDKVDAQGKILIQRIDVVSAELDSVAGSMSPTGGAPAKK
jgi:chromosome segregation ATPase